MKITSTLSMVVLTVLAMSGCMKSPEQPKFSAFNTKSAKLAEIPAGFEVDGITFGVNGRQVAFITIKDGKRSMSVDGKSTLPFDGVRDLIRYKDSDKYAFVASKGGKEFVVVNGSEGVLYDAIDWLMFAPDGRVIYEAKRGDKWLVVTGKPESSLFSAGVSTPIMSSDGKLLAYVETHGENKKVNLRVCTLEMNDCISGNDYDSISGIKGDLTSSKLSYIALKNNKKCLVTVDFKAPGLKEKESAWYDEVTSFNFSEDGEHLAFLAGRGNKNFLVKNSVETMIPPHEIVFDLLVAQNGRVFYTTLANNKVRAFLDGVMIGKEYGGIEYPVFNNDGTQMAYVVNKGSKSSVVLNGVEGPEFDKVVTPRFSPDGKMIVYRARNNGKRFVIVSDLQGKITREHPHYEAVWDVSFSPDGKSVGYGVKVGNELWWKVEKL
ncbi:MAG: hypothetical protein GJV46_02235 [Geobacter sp.]|nr:hypothetical protein [Geobacter sp.]